MSKNVLLETKNLSKTIKKEEIVKNLSIAIHEQAIQSITALFQ